MASDKNSFILYLDQRGTFNKLSDEQAGKLIKHIFSYCSDENPESDFVTELAFEGIKITLKRDLKKWEKQQEQRKEAGRKSAKIRQRNSTTVNDRSISSTVSVSDSVSVSVSDSVSVNNLKKEEKEDSTHTSTSEGAHTLSKKFQGLKFLLDLGVDRDVANDFIKCRTKKRLANTQTAFDGLKREIEKTGRMPNEIIRVAAEQGWGGFRASWDWQKHFESEDTEGLMDWDEMVPG